VDIRVILRSIVLMDNKVRIVRGWRAALASDIAVTAEQREAFSRVIEKYLLATEQYGWAVSVDSAKGYIEMAEAALESGQRWDQGREALRWLVKFERQTPEVQDWRGRMERMGGWADRECPTVDPSFDPTRSFDSPDEAVQYCGWCMLW
jgi:hypothetical protein